MLLSYFWDQTLVAGESDKTDYVAVVLRKGRLLLQANGAIYSWEDNYYNFRQAFEVLDWEQLPGNSCLVLGLGLGSIIQMAEELFGQELSYVAVEYDETIAALAEEYLLYRLHSPIETVIADAGAFVHADSRKYDLILLDIFVDDKVPKQFDTAAFLEDIQSLLHPNGLLVSNRLAFKDEDRENAYVYEKDVFKQVFAQADHVDVKSNLMLFSNLRFIKNRMIAS